MPYRRLPNTDNARRNALRTAIQFSQQVSPFNLAFSQQALLKAKNFLPLFDQTISRQKLAHKTQVTRGKEYLELNKRARLFISHFFQVMNLMIIRGELPEDTREFYGIDKQNKSVPLITSDADLLEWGKKLIDGDQERQRKSGRMITNPTAAIVRVHFEKFKSAYHYQKDLQIITNKALQKISEMRDQADSIILQIWNEVETHFAVLSEDEKRDKAAEYGLVYVYRPAEKKKLFTEKMAANRLKRLKEEASKSKETLEQDSEMEQEESSFFSNQN